MARALCHRCALWTDVGAGSLDVDSEDSAGNRDVFPIEFGIGDMDICHVRYFIALCEMEHFTRAAKLCGVSQPSLSNAIRALERELGGLLFERKPRVRLSPLGQSVRLHFEAIWREVRHVQGLIGVLARGGQAARR